MKKLFLAILFLIGLILHGQDFYPPVLNYSVKDYGTDRNPENYAVIQDYRGVMYFGNAHGILEFDGENWNYITVRIGEFVRSLAVDKNGTIFAGTFGDFGLLKANSKGQLEYQSLLNLLPEEDQFFGNIWRIYTIDEYVYFQAQECFYLYNTKTKAIRTIYPESSYHLSFLVGDQFYLRERGVGLVRFNPAMEIPAPVIGTDPFKEYGVFGMHQLADDSLLIITQEIGIFKWKNNAIRAIPDKNNRGLNQLGIFGSLALYDGTYLLTTRTEGAVSMNSNGEILKQIDRSTGLLSNTIHAAFQDRDLNVWLAMGNGISKVNYHSPMSYFNEKSGIEGGVSAIKRFKGKLFVGSAYGLFVQSSNVNKNKRFHNLDVVNGQVWDIKIYNNTLYIASGKGVFSSTDGENFKMLSRINANTLIHNKERQEFILAGEFGIWVFDNEFKEKWSYINDFSTFLGGEIDPMNANVIWLGTLKYGIVKLKAIENDYQIDFYGHEEGLLDDIGTPLLLHDKLVFGAKDGLYYFESEEEIKKSLTTEELKDPLNYKGFFRPFELYDSLFNGQLLLLQAGAERTWYCNEFKIGYYDNQKKDFFNKPFWGLDYGRINTLYLEDDGVLWIGAVDGLVRFEKNDFKQYKSNFLALVRDIYIGRDSILFGGVYNHRDTNNLMVQIDNEIPALDYAFNDLRFVFSAPYFEDEHEPMYRFKLVGNDNDWSAWSYKSEANFTNLSHGEYEFQVEAKNVYGQLSQQSSYKFSIYPPWYLTKWAFLLYFFMFILIFYVAVKISSKRLKAKNLWLKEVIEERTKEISDKNVVLEHQKKEIEDSINYALKIQEAILPLEAEMKRFLPESFILFRPKDIVSGDFYWFVERDDKLIVICADCTGHGVPGALMSMIGSDRLNIIVSERKNSSPSKILSDLNKSIKKSLKQDGQKNSTRDGMDAAVCTVDLKTKTMQYAGANRPLWIVHENELTEIKATKVAVAGFTSDDQVYEEHIIELQPGMKFFMSTDGYADQFGGKNDKKFKVKTLKDLLVEISNNTFIEQKKALESALINWMGETEQVDDICIIGFEPKFDNWS